MTTLPYPLFHPRCSLPPPLTLTPEEFSTAFPSEDLHIEFKRGIGAAIQNTAVAFSNAEGGVILVGVEDDGSVSGRALDAGSADQIHDAFSSAHDLGRYGVNPLDVGGIQIIVVSVAKREQGFSQTANGRVLVRRGTRDDPLFGSALQRLLNERSAGRYEATPTRSTLADVPEATIERIEQAYGWPKGRGVQSGFSEIGLVDGEVLTVAGALCLLEDPATELGKTYIEVLRYQTDEGVEYDRREEIHGPVDRQLAQGARLITEHLGTDLVVLGLKRYELPKIPDVVIREALANAVAHRSYEASGTAVRIELRPSHVAISSPGGLPEPVTIENMREASAARNLSLIGVLRRLGLAEDAGRGIDVMQDTMESEMLDPPVFTASGHSVTATLPTRSAVAPVERAWIRELESRGDLSARDRLLLVHAARGTTLSNSSARDLLHLDSREARRVLQRLCKAGFLRQHGERGGVTYELASSLRPPAGLRLDADEIANLVTGLAAHGPLSNADVRTATGLDRAESLAILSRLVQEGSLIRVGQRRGTRYLLPGTETADED